jgi:hypothetical protein
VSLPKVIFCAGCGREVEQDDKTNAEGHPFGLYNLTANCPRWFNLETGKPYRWIGTFCSVDCLIAHGATLREQTALLAGVYECE